MNELVPMVTERDGVPVTTSRAVAEQFEKQHKHVLRDIETIIGDLKKTEKGRKFTEPNFGLSKYRDSTGRELPMYLLTRNGFTLLAMGFTGARALEFKVSYIDAFDRMEQLLKGGGLSSPALQDMERRLAALEHGTGQKQEGVQDEAVEQFFAAIRSGLASGEYWLKDKWMRESQEEPGELIGVEDGSRTFLKSELAYKLYRAAGGTLKTRAALWTVLERAGEIRPRSEVKRIAINHVVYTMVCIDGSKLQRAGT